jgi:hypothetical protein
VAEVGAGVVGEQHGDEAKLVAWSAGLGNGRRCGVDGVVLCFGDFLRGRLGGRQLDARALLRELRPEPRGGCSGGGRGGPRHGARAAMERRRKVEEQSGMGVGVSGETWFLLNAKAGIRVAVDKRSTWPTIVASVGLWAVEVDGRWRGSMATRGECGDEATRALG